MLATRLLTAVVAVHHLVVVIQTLLIRILIRHLTVATLIIALGRAYPTFRRMRWRVVINDIGAAGGEQRHGDQTKDSLHR